MKAAIYARVSTVDQNCELQLRELREYITNRKWSVAGEYVDTGWSGTKANRPELDRLMRDASQRKFDAILVWKLDRFGRSVQNCIQGISDLKTAGVRFMAVSQGIDTDESNPTAKLMLHIFAAFAEFERELIRERAMAGQARYNAQYATAPGVTPSRSGKNLPTGRPRRVFRRDEARSLRREGRSFRHIARVLGVPVTTVVDACRAEA